MRMTGEDRPGEPGGPDHSPGGGSMSQRNQAGQRGASVPGPERPGWPFLVAGGLIYAGVLLGIWIVLAGQPDVQDLVAGSAAAVVLRSGGLLGRRGGMMTRG